MTLAPTQVVATLVSEVEEALQRGDMRSIEKIVLTHRGTTYEPQLLADPRIQRLVERLRTAYCAYETDDEYTLRIWLLQAETGQIAGSAPIERTHTFAPLEAAAAGIGDNANYCHVGSGPLPETLLAIRAVAPSASLTGIDADAQATSLGREFTRAIAPGSAIRFLHAAGHTVDYRGFTHVHIAVLVRPEYDVVQRVCDTADAGVTVLLRTAAGLGSLLYRPVGQETELLLLRHGFTRTAIVRGHAIMETAIYRR